MLYDREEQLAAIDRLQYTGTPISLPFAVDVLRTYDARDRHRPAASVTMTRVCRAGG